MVRHITTLWAFSPAATSAVSFWRSVESVEIFNDLMSRLRKSIRSFNRHQDVGNTPGSNQLPAANTGGSIAYR